MSLTAPLHRHRTRWLLFVSVLLIVASVGAASENLSDLKARVEKGDGEEQAGIGDKYFIGKEVPQNYAEAAKWYRMAADQGHTNAKNSLEALYRFGQGVAQDYTEALKCYRMAAEQGHALAQFNLGQMYREGHGVAQDYTKAHKWFRKAAERGSVSVQHNLGAMYIKGQGVAQDYAESLKVVAKMGSDHWSVANFYQCELFLVG